MLVGVLLWNCLSISPDCLTEHDKAMISEVLVWSSALGSRTEFLVRMPIRAMSSGNSVTGSVVINNAGLAVNIVTSRSLVVAEIQRSQSTGR